MEQTINYLPSSSLLDRHAPLSPVWGCPEIRAHIAPDVFGLWDAWEQETGGEREIPYWAVVWPAAVVFARYLIDNPETCANKSILDLGCGSGVASIAAAKSGAREVTANDIDPVALHVALRNSAANGVSFTVNQLNLVELEHYLPVEVVLAADLFYERSKASAQESYLRNMARRGASVFLVDGGRAFAPRSGMEELLCQEVPVNHPLEGVATRTVRLFRVDAP